MYEAKQCKEKVSRKIDGGDRGVQQKKKIDNQRKDILLVRKDNVHHMTIQPVNDEGFRTVTNGYGFITLAVDRANLGHTYIIIEKKDGAWMYHFKANANSLLGKASKVIAWEGTFEKIQREGVKGKNSKDFVKQRSMSFQELKVSSVKADTVKQECEKSIGTGFFSLVLSNIKIGDNCFSKVYNILKKSGFQLTWSSYLLSFISPRLALWLGYGFYDVDKKEKTSTYFYKDKE